MTTHLDQLATMAGQIVSNFDDYDSTSATMAKLLSPIEEVAPRMQAETPREALFQLLLAAAEIGNLVGTEMDEESLRETHMRIEGCIISAINVFERACRLDRTQLGGEYFARCGYEPQLWQREETGGPAS